MKWLRYPARVIIVLWVVPWILLSAYSILFVTGGDVMGGMLFNGKIFVYVGALLVGSVFLYIAWHKILASGIIFSLVGILIFVLRHEESDGNILGFLMTSCALPLIGGILFLLASVGKKKALRKANTRSFAPPDGSETVNRWSG